MIEAARIRADILSTMESRVSRDSNGDIVVFNGVDCGEGMVLDAAWPDAS